jgi:hypothetical protein
MAQYPLQTGNETAIADGLNYLLSGPAGLGQDFTGYEQWTPGYLTGNFRIPYTQLSVNSAATGVSGQNYVSVNPTAAGILVGMTVSGYGITPGTTVTSIGAQTAGGVRVNLSAVITANIDNDLTFYPNPLPKIYVAPIPLGTSTLLDPYTWKFEFASPEASPPFVPGNNISVYDVRDGEQSAKEFTLSGTKAALGSTTTYSGIIPTTITGSGTGLELDITLLASGAVAYSTSNTIIDIVDGGIGYVVGDIVKVLGTALGGTSPANDLTLTVLHTTSAYDGDYTPIGVAECTTTYVIARTTDPYTVPGPGTGGYVWLYNTSAVPKVLALSTDCNSKIIVNGGNDRVFISAQLNNRISYSATTSSDLSYAVAINRYRGFPNTDPANPGFFFEFDKLIAKRVYTGTGLTGLSGTGTLSNIETIFTNFPDVNITPAYYWYIMDVSFQVTNGGDLQVTQSELGLRSMSTQTVKQ